MKEPRLEKVLRRWRLRRVDPHLPEGGSLLDLGCGWQAALLRHAAPRIRAGFGLDPKAEPADLPANVRVVHHRLEAVPWPLPEPQVDAVSMLAVLEHLDQDVADAVLSEVRRVLRSDGRLVLTVPTPSAKPVLEFLAFRLGVVNPDEIRDHKIYYDRGRLESSLARHGFAIERYRTFQLGWNSLCVARPA
jgi:cyclopropane fatty-acyl-phospholipid synthase-like methyltransferase